MMKIIDLTQSQWPGRELRMLGAKRRVVGHEKYRFSAACQPQSQENSRFLDRFSRCLALVF